jgi:hypothetical protein
MDFSSKMEDLQDYLYDIKYQFSEKSLDSAIEIIEELYEATDCNCSYELKYDLTLIKQERKVSNYNIEKIEKHWLELVKFFDIYDSLDNDYDEKTNISLTAIKMCNYNLYDRIKNTNTIEEYKEEYEKYEEELNDLTEEFNNNRKKKS